MSRVRFTNGVSSVMVDLAVTRTWQAAVTGDAGNADLFVPYNAGNNSSRAASPMFIDPDGGSFIHIASESGSGEWFGIVTKVDFGMTGLRVRALQPLTLMGKRVVHMPGTVRNVSAGYIVSTAMASALSGVTSLHMQYRSEGGGPNIDEYEFGGQDLWSVISDMQERTGYEVHVEAATGRVDWVGPLSQSTRFGTLLVAGGNLRDWSYGVDVTDRVSEVIGIFEDDTTEDRFPIRNGSSAVGGWPAQALVSASHQGELYGRTATELAARSKSVVELAGSVASDLWTIRERDTALVLVPRAGFSGRFGRYRVMARTLSDDTGLMRLEFQKIQETAAGPQSFPKGRTTTTYGRGRGRSRNRLLHLNRRFADIARMARR